VFRAFSEIEAKWISSRDILLFHRTMVMGRLKPCYS